MKSNIITPKARRVVRMSDALRKLRIGDAIVMPRPHRSWSGVHYQAQKVGIEVTTSALYGDPSVIVRIA